MNKLIVFIFLAIATQAVAAQTEFIKYKNYLIPIGQPLAVTTSTSSNRSNIAATLALILERGGPDTTVWFEVSTSNNLVCGPPGLSALNSGTIGEGERFQTTVNNLVADTDYFFRACAISVTGTIASGEIDEFKTTNNINVSTGSAREVTGTSALLVGTLNAGRDIEVWFVLLGGPLVPNCPLAPPAGTNTFLVSAGQSFSDQRINLANAQTFGFRACARRVPGDNSFLLDGGSRFTTDDSNTEVATLSATSILPTSARLSGEVVSGTNVDASFVIGITENIQCSSTLNRETIRNRNTGDPVSINVTRTNDRSPIAALLSNTKYYYRFCARNPRTQQIASGDVESFITDGDGGVLDLVRVDRSDMSATFTGRLRRGGQPKNTWFILALGFSNLSSSDCASRRFPRLGERTLNGTSQSNVLDTNNVSSSVLGALDSNTRYTVGFCGEGVSNGTGEISLGEIRQFTTKRNSNDEVVIGCGADITFSSADGPLTVNVRGATSPEPFSFNASLFNVFNFGNANNVQFRILTRNAFGVRRDFQTVPRQIRRTAFVTPPELPTNRSWTEYRVQIPDTGNWRAQFNCQTIRCLRTEGIGGIRLVNEGACTNETPLSRIPINQLPR